MTIEYSFDVSDNTYYVFIYIISNYCLRIRRMYVKLAKYITIAWIQETFKT